MSEKIMKILEHGTKYQRALKEFNKMTDNIEAASGRDAKIPAICFPDDDDKSLIETKIGNYKIICRMRYTGLGSSIEYGFLAPNKYNKLTFHKTNRLYFDRYGNNLVEKGGKQTRYTFENADDLHSIYYPQILDAAEKAWAYYDKN